MVKFLWVYLTMGAKTIVTALKIKKFMIQRIHKKELRNSMLRVIMVCKCVCVHKDCISAGW